MVVSSGTESSDNLASITHIRVVGRMVIKVTTKTATNDREKDLRAID